MSKFNSSISVLGFTEVKVQQAILKLLENSLYQKELLGKSNDTLTEQIRRLSQKLSTVEKIGWAHVNVRVPASTYLMSGLVSDQSATYNVNVTFRNTTATARSCKVNGTTVELAGSDGATADSQFAVAGNGSFTIDNIESSVDVFVKIWR